jgi:uncharacterized protein (TIGR03663 family)
VTESSVESAVSGESGAAAGRPPARLWWTAIIYLAAAAMLLRFYDLPLKPLHHDEGVNTLFLTGLVEPPHVYRYDPANYHGPTLYYFAWLSVAVLGLTTVAIRAVTATAGLMAVFVVLALRRQIGTVGALAAGSLLALSPGAVYVSRYFIHEMLLVCFTVAAVVATVSWWQRRRARDLYLAALAAGLMFATKETAVISAVVIGIAAAGAAALVELRARLSEPGRGLAVGDMIAALLQSSRRFAGTLRERVGAQGLAGALAVFVATNVLFYTSFFTHWHGAISALQTFAIWTKTGTSAHPRPWHTYLEWLSIEELPLLLLGAAGALLALWKSENRFAVFAALWSIGEIAAYSLIPYKTPWLMLNMTAPLALAAGYACDRVWQLGRTRARLALGGAALAVAALMTYQALVLNFIEYDDDRHPYVYAHTSRELLAMVREINLIEAANPRSSIAITSPDHFPLSWYLRDYPVGYYGRVVVTKDPLVIAAVDQQEALDAALGGGFERIGVYSLRPGVQLVLYASRQLRRGSTGVPQPSPPRTP